MPSILARFCPCRVDGWWEGACEVLLSLCLQRNTYKPAIKRVSLHRKCAESNFQRENLPTGKALNAICPHKPWWLLHWLFFQLFDSSVACGERQVGKPLSATSPGWHRARRFLVEIILNHFNVIFGCSPLSVSTVQFLSSELKANYKTFF